MATSKIPSPEPENNSSEATPDTNFEFGANSPPPNNTPPATPSTPAPDPFDPANLRLTGDFAANVGVKKVLLTVPYRKPDKSWFFRVNPDPNYQMTTCVIELKEEGIGGETYLVHKDLWPQLATEAVFSPRAFYTCINKLGAVFIWGLKLPAADGRFDEWGRTAMEAANRGQKCWVRIAANMTIRTNDVFEAIGKLGEPEWPTTPFTELLRIAFKDRIISDLNHPILRRLRGEV